MIKLENFEVVGWEHAIRGMRNPKNSWARSDSEMVGQVLKSTEPIPGVTETHWEPCVPYTKVGPNDHKLMMDLAKGGSVHAKYRRMITVYVDITAPLYWWKEFDTYKVGTVANSCSTMHKIHDKEFTLEDFSCEHLIDVSEDMSDVPFVTGAWEDSGYTPLGILECWIIPMLNKCRDKFNETKAKPMKNGADRAPLMKKYFDQMIQLLPSSYNQKRTIMLNYEVLANIYRWRKDHKLDEWREFCKWIETLPYSEVITGGKDDENS